MKIIEDEARNNDEIPVRCVSMRASAQNEGVERQEDRQGRGVNSRWLEVGRAQTVDRCRHVATHA